MTPDFMDLARAERADLATLLRELTPEQWEAPSLCTEWPVRDVVAHVVSYEELDGRGLLRRYARGRFVPRRVNAVGVGVDAGHPTHQLVEVLERHLQPRGLTAGFGGRIALVDGVIHHQDIRRPLGLLRDVPVERLRPVLDFARLAPPIGAFTRIRGLRLVATDFDWAAGKGAEVSGPGEALLMAMAGRGDALDELCGAGLAVLARRVTPRRVG
jgi:uncharacterized protein (TIGR03083 family)